MVAHCKERQAASGRRSLPIRVARYIVRTPVQAVSEDADRKKAVSRRRPNAIRTETLTHAR